MRDVMDGAERRERMVERITAEFVAEHGLMRGERAALMGAVRIGMLEATRGLIWCWHVMSPSMRETLEAHWGFSGVKPERP
jgi:hypothetical protein